jgi:hypothetical protein
MNTIRKIQIAVNLVALVLLFLFTGKFLVSNNVL